MSESAIPAGYTRFTTPAASIVARIDAAPAIARLLEQQPTLYAAAAVAPEQVLTGRIAAYAVRLADEPWLVRHYHRGGAVARVLGDRYARLGGDRALRELVVSEDARARGIATPAVIAIACYRRPLFARFDIASEFIPQARDLAALLFEDAAREGDPRFTLIAQLIRRMVSSGLMHADLNLKNILVSSSRAWIIDLDRCVLRDRPSGRDALRMRDRLVRSLEKWQKRTGQRVPAGIRMKLEGAFGG